MANFDRDVLDFYQLPTPYPSEWPAEKDEDDNLSDDEAETKKQQRQHRKSRYHALERVVSNRRSVASTGSGKRNGGRGNIVQKDEPDPLGSSDSVVRSLMHKGVSLQDDVRLRNRFLLSSTTFSPALFLSQMHHEADNRALLHGLNVLSQSIDQKSASLKALVETNFERFVRAKATIDNVYKEMKYRGSDPPSAQRQRAHSRQISRSSFRNSMNGPPSQDPSIAQDTRKKNSLVKESEYGVMGIKTPLLDVSAKAEEVWGPALGGREQESNLKTVQKYLGRFRDHVELSAVIADSIKRKDFESIVEEYNKARMFADQARRTAQKLGPESPPDDAQVYQILLAGRVWHDVSQQVQAFKVEIWKKLGSQTSITKSDGTGGRFRNHLDFINLLLELGVDDNPVAVWLASRYEYLKGKIEGTADRQKVEIEVLRRRLASSEQPTSQATAMHLRAISRQPVEGKSVTNDSPEVLELWEKIVQFLTGLLSPEGVLGEMLEFWTTAQGFIDGTSQSPLPRGYNGESRKYHQLSEQVKSDLQKGLVELVELIREHVYAFFAEPPPEDISLLYSPIPPTPVTPGATTPVSATLSPNALRDPRFNLDPHHPPPSSPKRGEPWEKLAFWPPWSNSISGVHYLSKMLALVGSGASDMASMRPITSGSNQSLEGLKTLVLMTQDRCVNALLEAWSQDAANIKYLEDWYRTTELGDVTRMPARFLAFEGTLLSGMQKLLYVSEAMSKPGAENIVLPPPTKLLQNVRNKYVSTLYKALSGLVENARRSLKQSGDEWSTGEDADLIDLSKSGPNPNDKNIRLLLTLSNLQSLRSSVVPTLNTQFENAFSVKLTDESKRIRDALTQIDTQLFELYTNSSKEKLAGIIQKGLSADDWVPTPGTRPSAPKPYIYEVLLTLVLVHSQVSTTAHSLTPQVLSHLLEQTFTQLLEVFGKRSRYTLEALLQATLDVEFISQTLMHYSTPRGSELCVQIYAELDSRTDNDARARLQSELPEMKSVLKKLREASKNEFACFRRPRRPGQSQGRTDSGLSSN